MLGSHMDGMAIKAPRWR